MPIGNTYREDITLDSLTHEEFLAASITVAESLGWIIQSLKDDSLEITTPERADGSYELITITIDGKNAEIKSEPDGPGFGTTSPNKQNVDAFINALNPVIANLTPEKVGAKLKEYNKDLEFEEENIVESALPEVEKDDGKWWSFFIPSKDFFITPILVNLNIFIFLMMAISGVGIFEPEIGDLLKWGANSRASTLDGEVWRLLTACFVHIGIIHLVMNMVGLVYIGALLEPLIGRSRFLGAYLLTGIAASAMSLAWHVNTVAAGASGAIFGMFGVYLALATTNLFDSQTRKALLKFIGIYIAVNLVYSAKDGIDAAAHLGGLLSGLVIGYVFYPGMLPDAKRSLKTVGLAASSLAVVAFTMYIFKTTSSDIIIFDRTMGEFSMLESEALNLYKLPAEASEEDYVKFIRNNGIPDWQKSIKLLKSVENLNLPSEMLERNKQMQEYVQLRLETYELLQKSYSEGSEEYDERIEEYNNKTAALLKKLNGE